MNTRTIARDWTEKAPQSLRERIARFAMAIDGCSAQDGCPTRLGTGQTGIGT